MAEASIQASNRASDKCVGDFLVLWAWEYDEDFIVLLQKACDARGVSTCIYGPQDMPTVAERLNSGALEAKIALDRVWDWGGEYERHVEAVKQHVPQMINDYALVRRAWNKPTMHMELISHGLYAPYLILLPSYDQQPDLAPIDLNPLGSKFSVKGAHSGGSGVLKPAKSWAQVLERRKEWPSDETIVQAWVEPKTLGKHRAWFRVFYACGATYLCWADDRTHVQTPVTSEDEGRFQLGVLRGMVQQIAGLCGLNLFSTEIALDERNLWQVCDYVNDPCDFRLKSTVDNGVPDEVVEGVCDRIAGFVRKMTRG